MINQRLSDICDPFTCPCENCNHLKCPQPLRGNARNLFAFKIFRWFEQIYNHFYINLLNSEVMKLRKKMIRVLNSCMALVELLLLTKPQ